jgi:hypothetical protein
VDDAERPASRDDATAVCDRKRRRVAHYAAVEGPLSIHVYDIKSGALARSINKRVGESGLGMRGVIFSEDGQALLIPKVVILRVRGQAGGLLVDLSTGAETAVSAAFELRKSTASSCAAEMQDVFAKSP